MWEDYGACGRAWGWPSWGYASGAQRAKAAAHPLSAVDLDGLNMEE